MFDFFGSVLWFIVALGLLVSFHEYGHFWVARRLGVKVLRYSIGFGRPLWRRLGADGTEYVVAAIPLGGYVKMLDEREGDVPRDQLDRAFNRKPLGVRTAIVAAGPIFNLIFAVAAFWLMFVVGREEIRPVFAEPTAIAAAAGMEAGDEIVAVDGRVTETLTEANLELLGYALDRQPVSITVADERGNRRDLTLAMDRLGEGFREERMLDYLGLSLWQPRIDAVLGTVEPDTPAARAGLQPGDQILAIDGRAVEQWRDLSTVIQAAAEAAPGQPLPVLIERDGQERTVPVTPQRRAPDQPFQLGVRPQVSEEQARAARERLFTVLRHGPLEAAGQAFSETAKMTGWTLGLLRRMLTGSASLRNLSGPIAIAQYANESASLGLAQFLFFLGTLSLSLAILNFLPIPLLDGGHLLYYFIEWIKGSPVSERSQIIGQYVGLTALAALISLTFYNDILRVLS